MEGNSFHLLEEKIELGKVIKRTVRTLGAAGNHDNISCTASFALGKTKVVFLIVLRIADLILTTIYALVNKLKQNCNIFSYA